MQNTLSYLGSTELYEKIITDLNEIIQAAFESGYIPIQLSVGRLFVEMSCCHSLIVDLEIQDWSKMCEKNPRVLSELLEDRLVEVLAVLEENSGFLGEKETIEIYYDPDEPYISLNAIYPQKSEGYEEYTTGDGYPIRRFRFKDDELEPSDFLH